MSDVTLQAALLDNPVEDTVATLVNARVVSLPDPTSPVLDLGNFTHLHARLRDEGVPLIRSIDFDGDIYSLPFRNETFRATVARDVFERLDGREFPKIVAEICRITKHSFFLPMTLPLVIGTDELFTVNKPDGSFYTQFGDQFLKKLFADLGFDLRMAENSVMFKGCWVEAIRHVEHSLSNL